MKSFEKQGKTKHTLLLLQETIQPVAFSWISGWCIDTENIISVLQPH